MPLFKMSSRAREHRHHLVIQLIAGVSLQRGKQRKLHQPNLAAPMCSCENSRALPCKSRCQNLPTCRSGGVVVRSHRCWLPVKTTPTSSASSHGPGLSHAAFARSTPKDGRTVKAAIGKASAAQLNKGSTRCVDSQFALNCALNSP